MPQVQYGCYTPLFYSPTMLSKLPLCSFPCTDSAFSCQLPIAIRVTRYQRNQSSLCQSQRTGMVSDQKNKQSLPEPRTDSAPYTTHKQNTSRNVSYLLCWHTRITENSRKITTLLILGNSSQVLIISELLWGKRIYEVCFSEKKLFTYMACKNFQQLEPLNCSACRYCALLKAFPLALEIAHNSPVL